MYTDITLLISLCFETIPPFATHSLTCVHHLFLRPNNLYSSKSLQTGRNGSTGVCMMKKLLIAVTSGRRRSPRWPRPPICPTARGAGRLRLSAGLHLDGLLCRRSMPAWLRRLHRRRAAIFRLRSRSAGSMASPPATIIQSGNLVVGGEGDYAFAFRRAPRLRRDLSTGVIETSSRSAPASAMPWTAS